MCLGALMFICVVIQCFTMASFDDSLACTCHRTFGFTHFIKMGSTPVSPPPYTGYRGCYMIEANHMMVWNYMSTMVIEASK